MSQSSVSDDGDTNIKVEDDDKYDLWEDDNLGQWAGCPGAPRGGIGIFWAATHSIDPRTKIFGSHAGGTVVPIWNDYQLSFDQIGD